MRWLILIFFIVFVMGAWSPPSVSAQCKVFTTPPTYTEGQLKDPTCDIHGALATGGGAGSATAAAPVYTEGSTGSWSFDLAGNARVTLGTQIAGEDLTATQTNSSGLMVTETRWNYEDVAASQTDQVMGGTGGIGDVLHSIFCTFSADPTTGVSVEDATGTNFTVINDPGAAANLNTGALDWRSAIGAWEVTTGTNTTCRVAGRFTP